MPWQLTTALDVGDLDVANYDQIRVTHLMHDSVRKLIHLSIEYGRTVADVWTPGATPAGKETSFTIMDTEYDNLIAGQAPDVQTIDPSDAIRYVQDGVVWVEKTYYATKRGVYEYLNSQGHTDAGSVV